MSAQDLGADRALKEPDLVRLARAGRPAGAAPRIALPVRAVLRPLALAVLDASGTAAAVLDATVRAGIGHPVLLAGAAGLSLAGLGTIAGAYRPRPSWPVTAGLFGLVARCGLVTLLASVSVVIARLQAADPDAAGLAALAAVWPRSTALACGLAVGGRLALHTAARAYRRHRPARHVALVVGDGATSDHLLRVLRHHRELGFQPLGRLATAPAGGPGHTTGHGTGEPGVPVLGDVLDLRRVAQAHQVDTVFIVADDVDAPMVGALTRISRGLARETLVVPPAGHHAADPAASVRYLAGLPCLSLDGARHAGLARLAKRAFDLGAALALLAALWPVLALCAAAVRLEGGPGVLFRQRRVGEGGREFVLLKFRTLKPADEHEADLRWSVDGDERMGPVGRFLRRMSLDELPQLWNVVRGDMSLVGPRPERPHFVRRFTEDHPDYPLRHRVPVGITGWSQVHGLRGDTSIEMRTRFDNHYIDTWSFRTDMTILLLTLRAVFVRDKL
ncbi:exopolysaccharide biosynthesis polyprenyl glycosylphosphotransferase [Actinomadura macrotermitis]|uniref:Bacterial sugar transferase domain-containing protein n=1 Tax=Actinomadura macrotermitis TaxID=2585200 RepID=A0A7K0BR68_9ACTN|nr:hypothetical protein [Actinomadura macrotermitis]